MRLHAAVGYHRSLEAEIAAQIGTKLCQIVIGHVGQRIQVAHVSGKRPGTKSAVLGEPTQRIFAEIGGAHGTSVDPRVRCEAMMLDLGVRSKAGFGNKAFALKYLVAVMSEPNKLVKTQFLFVA